MRAVADRSHGYLIVSLVFFLTGFLVTVVVLVGTYLSGAGHPYDYCGERVPAGVPPGPGELGVSYTWHWTLVPLGLNCIYYGNPSPVVVFHDAGTALEIIGLASGIGTISFGSAAVVSRRRRESTK